MAHNFSTIVREAWVFVKNYGFTFSEAMKQAWAIYKLKAAMKKGIVKFFFDKVDGTVREAFGTLDERVVPSSGGSRSASPSVVPYWDTEKQAWRCFKKVNLRVA